MTSRNGEPDRDVASPRLNWPAIGSCVAGLAALLVAVGVFPLTFVLAPVAAWLGQRGLRLVRELRAPGRALAWWGIASAGLGYLFALVMTVLAYTSLSQPEVRRVMEQLGS